MAGYEPAVKLKMALAHDWPRLNDTQRSRVQTALDAGCRCGHGQAALVKRQTKGGAMIVQLQCLNCGTGLAGTFPRDQHPYWTNYREYNPDLTPHYRAMKEEEWEQDRDNRILVAQFDKEKYDEWLRTSPEWKAMRRLVWKRAGGICEACLSAKIVDVHHTTYQLGYLPPAWTLHGVCRECHETIHSFGPKWGLG
jgi:5-methylcytosine-specific restriction endonuclease McrA